MAAQRAAFPQTGGRARSHQDAELNKGKAIASLQARDAAKAKAAAIPAGTDTNALNAKRARAGRWSDGSVPGQHTVDQ